MRGDRRAGRGVARVARRGRRGRRRWPYPVTQVGWVVCKEPRGRGGEGGGRCGGAGHVQRVRSCAFEWFFPPQRVVERGARARIVFWHSAAARDGRRVQPLVLDQQRRRLPARSCCCIVVVVVLLLLLWRRLPARKCCCAALVAAAVVASPAGEKLLLRCSCCCYCVVAAVVASPARRNRSLCLCRPAVPPIWPSSRRMLLCRRSS